MNIFLIAYKNLLRRKTRTLLTIFGISLSAWVLTSLLGFNSGYEASLNHDIDQMGFQVLLTAKGCPYEAATLMLKGGTGLRYINEDVMQKVKSDKDVAQVTPMLMQGVFDPNKGENGGISAYLGVDPKTFPGMKPFLEFKQGGWFTKEDALETVIGYEAAELEQREVGDILLIPEKNVELKVVGILKRSGTQDDGTIFVPVKAVQDIFGRKGQLTGLGIKVMKEADMDKFVEKLYDLPDVQVVSMAQVKSTIMNLLASAKVMVFSIALIAILIAMTGVINTILMSVMERVQEIGILKSIGAMPSDIFKLIWIETLILCVLGAALGVLLSLSLSHLTEILIRQIMPYTPSGPMIRIDARIASATFLSIAAAGFLSGVYPALRAAKVRPIEFIRNGVD
jgi:putative ABC transport system permease protein